MERFGDLKKEIDEQLNLPINQYTRNLLRRIKARLEVCGHCNGVTYKDGTCVEHFV